MNPPFGTSLNESIDSEFIKLAVNSCTGPVFVLQKTSTKKHMEKLAANLGRTLEVLREFDYEISKTEFDKKDMKKWNEKKYGKGSKAPREYHKLDSVSIKCALFLFDASE